MFYFWLELIIVLGILEALTINLVSIWFIISGLISLIISFFIDSFTIQFAIFVILGIILMLLTRKTLTSKLVKKTEKTNFDRILGMKGVVAENIDDKSIGEVKVDGKRWSAISDSNLKVGTQVKILKIEGTKLKVEPLKIERK